MKSGVRFINTPVVLNNNKIEEETPNLMRALSLGDSPNSTETSIFIEDEYDNPERLKLAGQTPHSKHLEAKKTLDLLRETLQYAENVANIEYPSTIKKDLNSKTLTISNELSGSVLNENNDKLSENFLTGYSTSDQSSFAFTPVMNPSKNSFPRKILGDLDENIISPKQGFDSISKLSNSKPLNNTSQNNFSLKREKILSAKKLTNSGKQPSVAVEEIMEEKYSPKEKLAEKLVCDAPKEANAGRKIILQTPNISQHSSPVVTLQQQEQPHQQQHTDRDSFEEILTLEKVSTPIVLEKPYENNHSINVNDKISEPRANTHVLHQSTIHPNSDSLKSKIEIVKNSPSLKIIDGVGHGKGPNPHNNFSKISSNDNAYINHKKSIQHMDFQVPEKNYPTGLKHFGSIEDYDYEDDTLSICNSVAQETVPKASRKVLGTIIEENKERVVRSNDQFFITQQPTGSKESQENHVQSKSNKMDISIQCNPSSLTKPRFQMDQIINDSSDIEDENANTPMQENGFSPMFTSYYKVPHESDSEDEHLELGLNELLWDKPKDIFTSKCLDFSMSSSPDAKIVVDNISPSQCVSSRKASFSIQSIEKNSFIKKLLSNKKEVMSRSTSSSSKKVPSLGLATRVSTHHLNKYFYEETSQTSFDHIRNDLANSTSVTTDIQDGSHLNPLNITTATDFAVKDDSMISSSIPDEELDIENEFLDNSYSTCKYSAAETTMTLDNNISQLMDSLILHNNKSFDVKCVPNFAIKSMKRQKSEFPDMKEINFDSVYGEPCMTSVYFSNSRKHPMILNSYAISIRIDKVDKEMKLFEESASFCDFFEVVPNNLRIEPGKSAKVDIKFIPNQGIEGIYNGALKIKSKKKNFVILLRGTFFHNESKSSLQDFCALTPSQIKSSDKPENSSQRVFVSENKYKTLFSKIKQLNEGSSQRSKSSSKKVPSSFSSNRFSHIENETEYSADSPYSQQLSVRNSSKHSFHSNLKQSVHVEREVKKSLYLEESINEYISSAKKTGVFFRKDSFQFGTIESGSLTRTKIELCNASDDEVHILLSDPSLPFVLLHTDIKLRARSYVRIPVRFIPIKTGSYHTQIIAKTSDNKFESTIDLYASSQ